VFGPPIFRPAKELSWAIEGSFNTYVRKTAGNLSLVSVDGCFEKTYGAFHEIWAIYKASISGLNFRESSHIYGQKYGA
jgi:hypothetical protein